MKNTSFPLLSMLALLVSGCGHHDSSSTPFTPIQGNWSYSPNAPTGVYVGAYAPPVLFSVNSSGVASGSNNGQSFSYQLEQQTSNQWGTTVIYSDGSKQTLLFVQTAPGAGTIIQYHYAPDSSQDGSDSGPATKTSSG